MALFNYSLLKYISEFVGVVEFADKAENLDPSDKKRS